MPAYLNFKDIAERVDPEQVAAHYGLMLKRSGKELRACCPACESDDERSLCIYPETASFRCFAAQKSGDSISLYAHLTGTGNYAAAKVLQEQLLGANAQRGTAPQKTEARKQPAPPSKSEHAFDPEAFAAKLTYTDEVSALGIAQDDAERLYIGYCTKGLMKGRVCFAVRNPDGSVAGFVGWNDEGLKVPKEFIKSNVVPLKRRA